MTNIINLHKLWTLFFSKSIRGGSNRAFHSARPLCAPSPIAHAGVRHRRHRHPPRPLSLCRGGGLRRPPRASAPIARTHGRAVTTTHRFSPLLLAPPATLAWALCRWRWYGQADVDAQAEVGGWPSCIPAWLGCKGEGAQGRGGGCGGAT